MTDPPVLVRGGIYWGGAGGIILALLLVVLMGFTSPFVVGGRRLRGGVLLRVLVMMLASFRVVGELLPAISTDLTGYWLSA